MIPDTPRLFAAAQDPELHATLTNDAAIGGLLARYSGNVDAMARNGVVAFAHLYDGWAAGAMIRRAARPTVAEIDAMTPAQQRATVAAVWGAFGDYWRALNVSPYAWRRLRWAFEDALGYPRSSLDRDQPLLAQNSFGDLLPGRPIASAEERAHFDGITSYRVEVVQAGAAQQRRSGDVGWQTGLACWRGAERTVEENGETVVYASPDSGCAPGLLRKRLRDRSASAQSIMPTAVRFGPDDQTEYEPGIAPIGVPNARSTLGNTGEVHRLWLWNDGTVLANAAMTDPSAAGVSAGATWNDDAAFAASRFFSGLYSATAPTRWYFDLLRAPVPGLKVVAGGPDVSLVEYLLATSPEEVIREVRRDVLVTNNLLRHERGITSDAQLFTRAQLDDFERRRVATTGALSEEQARQGTASAVMSGLGTVARAIGPEAGVIVGAASFAYQLGDALTQQVVAVSERHTDVFGRLMPAFERFEIADTRTVLVSTVNSMPLPPDITRIRGEVDLVRRTIGDIAVLGNRNAGRRTVVLVGLDPAQGARVFVDGRDLTLGLPETGRAQWTDVAGARVWRFGVPEATARVRVVYPDGRAREIDLPPVPSPEVDDSPEGRTAVLDATPPDAGSVGDTGAGGEYPARTVAVMGLPPGTTPTIYAGGRNVALDATPEGTPARWIDSTVPGVLGWIFGVPAGTREIVVVDALGPRTFALAPMPASLSVRDRVSTIDATRAGAPQGLTADRGTSPLAWIAGLGALAAGAWFIRRRAA